MYLGYAISNFFEIIVTSWTTLFPLTIVLFVSLTQNIAADIILTINIILIHKAEFKVELLYLEIYNEEARDLFSDNQSPLNIRGHTDDGVVVHNLLLHNIQ